MERGAIKEMSIAEGKGKWLWSAAMLCVWATVIWIFLSNHGNLSVQQLLDYTPEEPVKAAFVMLGLFCLKSLDFIMHSGILYAADGVMFPLPAAMALNLVGAAIICTAPYFVGRSLGTPVAQKLRAKYPKLANIEKLRLGDGFLTAMFLRVASTPLTVASIYMGATGMRFGPYLAGSLVGLIPVMASYAVMGAAADDPGSPKFIAGAGAIAVTTIVSIVIYALLLRRAYRRQTAAEEGVPNDE